jgi:hypothetical protein
MSQEPSASPSAGADDQATGGASPGDVRGADGDCIEGTSFPLAVKVLASVLVGALLVAAARALRGEGAADMPPEGLWFLLAALVVVVATWVAMLRSRTSISGTHIRQRWLWRKEVRIADISRVKLIHVPGLAWLIAPRLVVRAGGPALYTFHCADERVLNAFRALAFGVR